MVFFFCVFIAATGENLMHIVVGCTLLSIIFLFFITSKEVDLASASPDLLVQVPSMLGISVLYGHLTNQVKRDKRRIEKRKQTEELKRQVVWPWPTMLKRRFQSFAAMRNCLLLDWQPTRSCRAISFAQMHPRKH